VSEKCQNSSSLDLSAEAKKLVAALSRAAAYALSSGHMQHARKIFRLEARFPSGHPLPRAVAGRSAAGSPQTRKSTCTANCRTQWAQVAGSARSTAPRPGENPRTPVPRGRKNRSRRDREAKWDEAVCRFFVLVSLGVLPGCRQQFFFPGRIFRLLISDEFAKSRHPVEKRGPGK
jgi:hypothetical protein